MFTMYNHIDINKVQTWRLTVREKPLLKTWSLVQTYHQQSHVQNNFFEGGSQKFQPSILHVHVQGATKQNMLPSTAVLVKALGLLLKRFGCDWESEIQRWLFLEVLHLWIKIEKFTSKYPTEVSVNK